MDILGKGSLLILSLFIGVNVYKNGTLSAMSTFNRIERPEGSMAYLLKKNLQGLTAPLVHPLFL